jgi:myo-inositol-hexaphosphate 3-phosphohydrolase
VIKYDLATGQPAQEFVYITDPVAEPPIPADNFRTNGLVELLAIDDHGTALALERSYSAPVGNTVKLYEARLQGALDVSGTDDLMWEDEEVPFAMDPPIAKRLLVDFAELGVIPDNLEGMAFGPQLPDGRQSLIVVSDNNFSDTQTTQFIALALTLEPIGVARPAMETSQTIDEEEAPEEAIPGDSDDPAIWLHPTDPAQSLVLATLKDGGLAVFDLAGQLLDTIAPAEYGAFRYNNVDLIYNFELGGQPVDLAVASDRENDTLAVYQIDPESRQLTDVTAPDMLESIFGVDDGDQTAYGLATYTSPLTGITYAFVSRAGGNQMAQLELADNGSGQIQATMVQTMTLPVPSGEPEDSQSEGIVVDRELGFLYVAMEDGIGILKFPAEPETGEDEVEPVRIFNNEFLLPDVEGLVIYYGPDGSGYLLASSQGDSTFAVFERAGDNAYLGSFTVGDDGAIDQVNESDGADLINVSLGSAYPSGLLVVQDGANDPQFVAEDDEELENRSTNFKFVPWESVANAFPEPLLVDPTSFNPRQ